MTNIINGTVRASKTQGNGLFATKDIKPGEAILSIARPEIIALDAPRLQDTCANCFVWTAQSTIDGQEEDKTQWEGFMRLQAHIKHIKAQGDQEKKMFDVLSYGISQLAEAEKTGLSLDVVGRSLGIMMTNALTLVTPTFDPLGICIDPLVCSANHSCDPNAVVVFDGPSLSLRTLKAIKQDEEALISYIDNSDPYERRQQALQTRYNFTCECCKCQKGPTLREDSFEDADRIPSDHTSIQAAEECAIELLEKGKKCGNSTQALEYLSQAKKTLESTRIWPLGRQPSPSIQQQIFVNQLSAEQSKANALHSGFLIYFEIDPLLFPEPFHPVRIVHNFTLAMLVLFLSGEQGDEQILRLQEVGLDFGIVLYGLLQEVLNNVSKSHGVDSRFARMVKRRCEEVFTDMTRGTTAKLNEVEGHLDDQWALLRHLFTVKAS
ncbi:MAG: hypothetical protein Q9165_007417 [Trypethelium subeluteriae]